MVNFKIFNKSSLPLYTQNVNTYTSPGIGSLPSSSAASAGASFTLTSGSVTVPISQNLLLQISNPAGSGKTVYASSISGGSTAAATVNVYSGGTITGGTTPTPQNNLFGSTITSIVTTHQNNGTLGGSPVLYINVPVTAGLYSISLNGSLVVPPGQTLTITLGTGALTGSINLSWWEA
ncbi:MULTISPECIES: hypothetical protein [Paenibacillus]|uniref:Uncharacterized protein n=1 Tax=Paenibacillus azoreducens TaxID=116718 RepID=A0A919YAG1_9BACL|nr:MULTISPECIES: hypothetical protein [Paenibacillus]MBE9914026.1 hypothetical protein [Paenibacillus donghaensis]GIO45528.1 hypothetical protein J34TS1_02930 [Paenibacillus azoreducens]